MCGSLSLSYVGVHRAVNGSIGPSSWLQCITAAPRLNNIMGIWGVGQGWPAATAFVTVIGEYSECYSCTAPLYSDWTYILVLAKPAALSQSYCDEGFNHEGLCNGQGGRQQGVRRVRER